MSEKELEVLLKAVEENRMTKSRFERIVETLEYQHYLELKEDILP